MYSRIVGYELDVANIATVMTGRTRMAGYNQSGLQRCGLTTRTIGKVKRVASELIKGVERMGTMLGRMRSMSTFVGNDRRRRVHALSQVGSIPVVLTKSVPIES